MKKWRLNGRGGMFRANYSKKEDIKNLNEIIQKEDISDIGIVFMENG